MRKKLRIGILVDDNNIPAWSYKMLEKINKSEHSEIVLIVKKEESPHGNVSLFKRIASVESSLLKIPPALESTFKIC